MEKDRFGNPLASGLPYARVIERLTHERGPDAEDHGLLVDPDGVRALPLGDA